MMSSAFKKLHLIILLKKILWCWNNCFVKFGLFCTPILIGMSRRTPKTKKKVLGIKLRQSSDGQDEKKRKDFETILQKIDSNTKECRTLTLPKLDELPVSSYYPAMITALTSNRVVTSIDTSQTKLTTEQIKAILATLDKSFNVSLRRIDFR